MPKNEIINLVGKILEKESNKTLSELDAIKRVIIMTNNVVDIQILIPSLKHQDEIKREIAKIIKLDLNYPGVKIHIMIDKDNEIVVEKKEKNIKYLAVASGKGGVGKSTVAANLAYAFRRLGKKVGIIDVDIYGASIPFVFNMNIKPLDLNDDEEIIPALFEDIEVISTEFFVPKDKPLMWRAPIASQMTKMFFNSVAWSDDIELVIIDMPPGTGDIAIDVRELVPQSDMIIVTTPNIQASNVAVKAGLGSKELGHNIIGVIENMSYYYDSCSKDKKYLFGKGGGNLVASKVGVDLLAEIPITEQTSDDVIFDMTTIQGKIFLMLAKGYIEKNNL